MDEELDERKANGPEGVGGRALTVYGVVVALSIGWLMTASESIGGWPYALLCVLVCAGAVPTTFLHQERRRLRLALLLAAVGVSAVARRDGAYHVDQAEVYIGDSQTPESITESPSPTVFAVVTNDHGDVLELLDGGGAAFAAYRYDPWGQSAGAGNYATGIWTQGTSLVTSTLAGQIASRQILRYASYAYDAESGLYYCSARYYDPATRQWTTGDPAKDDGEESAYQYCGGEPVGGTDPDGQATQHRSHANVLSGSKIMRGWYYWYMVGPTGGSSSDYIIKVDFAGASQKGSSKTTSVTLRGRTRNYASGGWISLFKKTVTVRNSRSVELPNPKAWLTDTEFKTDAYGKTSGWCDMLVNQDY